MTIITRISCTGLALATAVVLVPLIGEQADAEFAGPTPLGPASELVLEGEGDNRVTLQSVHSHLAWGDKPTHRSYSEGWVSIGPLLDQLMRSESFQEERNTLSQEMQEDGTLAYTFTRPLGAHGVAYVDVLYLDNSLRIVRGHRGTFFVFTRIPDNDSIQ